MDDIAEKLAIRDSFLRKLAARRTPEERMREFWRLQRAMWERVQRNSEAWDLFKRQQFKMRAIDVRPEYVK